MVSDEENFNGMFIEDGRIVPTRRSYEQWAHDLESRRKLAQLDGGQHAVIVTDALRESSSCATSVTHGNISVVVRQDVKGSDGEHLWPAYSARQMTNAIPNVHYDQTFHVPDSAEARTWRMLEEFDWSNALNLDYIDLFFSKWRYDPVHILAAEI